MTLVRETQNSGYVRNRFAKLEEGFRPFDPHLQQVFVRRQTKNITEASKCVVHAQMTNACENIQAYLFLGVSMDVLAHP